MVGYPEYTRAGIYNSAALIADGAVAAIHRKAELPNYKVFDEKRYFQRRHAADGRRLSTASAWACWSARTSGSREPAQLARAAGARAAADHQRLALRDPQAARARAVVARARRATSACRSLYVNLVGGQDELVFDGNSFVMDAQGEVVMRAPPFEEGTVLRRVRARRARQAWRRSPATSRRSSPDEASVYGALVLGVRDYVNKHGFPGVVMGLSGGVDSALTLAIAVDALGAERVHAVMMPSRYTSHMSLRGCGGAGARCSA